MRISDAIAALSATWRVPVSELMSYHRALREAKAIPAYAAGRAADNVSEKALLHFVLAYCSSRHAKHCPQNLKHVLAMKSKSWHSCPPKGSPAFLGAEKVADVLAGAVWHAHAQKGAGQEHPDPISFEFNLDADSVEVDYQFLVSPEFRGESKPLLFVSQIDKRPDLQGSVDFYQTKRFGTLTLDTLARILTS